MRGLERLENRGEFEVGLADAAAVVLVYRRARATAVVAIELPEGEQRDVTVRFRPVQHGGGIGEGEILRGVIVTGSGQKCEPNRRGQSSGLNLGLQIGCTLFG